MEFQRKNIRLPALRYAGQNWYFLTLVTEGRVQRFLNPGLVAETLELARDYARMEGFAVWAYCFMPDHLHLMASGVTADASLPRFLTRFKQQTAYRFSRQNHQKTVAEEIPRPHPSRGRALGAGGVLHLDEPCASGSVQPARGLAGFRVIRFGLAQAAEFGHGTLDPVLESAAWRRS